MEHRDLNLNFIYSYLILKSELLTKIDPPILWKKIPWQEPPVSQR